MGAVSLSRRLVMIQEALRDDVIRTPLKVDGAALPGALEGDSAPPERHESIICSRAGICWLTMTVRGLAQS